MTRLTNKQMKTIILEEFNNYLSEVFDTSSHGGGGGGVPGGAVEPEGTPESAEVAPAEPEAEEELPAGVDPAEKEGMSSTEVKKDLFVMFKQLVPRMTPAEKKWWIEMSKTLANYAATKNALTGAPKSAERVFVSKVQKAMAESKE